MSPPAPDPLFPSRPAEIDRARAGETTHGAADGTADEGTGEGIPHQCAGDGTAARADRRAADGAFPRSRAAGGQSHEREEKGRCECNPSHDLSPVGAEGRVNP